MEKHLFLLPLRTSWTSVRACGTLLCSTWHLLPRRAATTLAYACSAGRCRCVVRLHTRSGSPVSTGAFTPASCTRRTVRLPCPILLPPDELICPPLQVLEGLVQSGTSCLPSPARSNLVTCAPGVGISPAPLSGSLPDHRGLCACCSGVIQAVGPPSFCMPQSGDFGFLHSFLYIPIRGVAAMHTHASSALACVPSAFCFTSSSFTSCPG